VLRPNFTIRHYLGSPVGPSSPSGAVPVSKQIALEVGKLLVQKEARDQLEIDEIPSPTHRPTKSLVDTAIGLFFGVGDEMDPSEGRFKHKRKTG
jgi:hypothetical protein